MSEAQYLQLTENKNLNKILELCINSDYYTIDDFRTNFKNFINTNIVSNILFNKLEQEIHYYFYDKPYKKLNDLCFNNKIVVKIKFGESDYLTFNEALETIQNIFLISLHDEILFKFYNAITFYTTNDSLKQNDRFFYDFKGNINYNSLIYFINVDWKDIKISDINTINQYQDTLTLNINPFFDTKSQVIDQINKIYKILNPIKINNKERIDKFNRLKRLFCLSWIIKLNHNCTYSFIYKELLKKNHTYSDNASPYNKEDSYSAEASQYTKQIKGDLKLIENIKKLNSLNKINKNWEITKKDTINIPPF